MRLEIAKKWAEALRGGEFPQGRHWLRNGDCYCCLGVLCELAIREGVIKDISSPGQKIHEYGLNRSTAVIPPEVKRWAELWSDIGFCEAGSLMSMNDNDGVNFTEIADAIERNAKSL